MADRGMRSGAHFSGNACSETSRQSVELERVLDRLSPGQFSLYLYLQKLQIREANLMINMARAGAFISSAFPIGRTFGESMRAQPAGG